MRSLIGIWGIFLLPAIAAAQPAQGQRIFEQSCAPCHGADGGGGEMGPPIALRLSTYDDDQLRALVRQGRPDRGMPPAALASGEWTALLAHLRTLQRREAVQPPRQRTVRLAGGGTLAGRQLGEGPEDLQVRTDDGAVHLLRRVGDVFRRVTSERDWPTYNGDPGGNRFTTIDQISPANVARLRPAWSFVMPGAAALQVTPVVVGGLMYVTAPNHVVALDAGTGRPVWEHRQPRTRGVVGGNANRGVAIDGGRLFTVTDHAHVIALDRFTGERLWATPLEDWRRNYAASSAPLVAGGLVIAGVSGGEHGANGFLSALDVETGREVWRFHTVPRPGEPGSETWGGKDIHHGGAPTWFTGSYDAALDTIYWKTGNPSKEYNGDDRKGDNLYSNCVLALDRATGRLKWHYQFTPHDLWDWDATQTSVLVDADWKGSARRLLLHADRNGFFYVFDRVTGELLSATPFVDRITWASGIGPDGRPVLQPNQAPTPEGTYVCPSQDGATNWFSPSYNPATGLLYVQTFDKCSIYTKSEQGDWESGKSYLGGSQRIAPDPAPRRILRAIDIRTGRIAWELPQAGAGDSWGGTLATSTGLVFFGEDSGAFMAADARTGAPLWHYPTNHTWRASPMTYLFDGRQHVAVAAGSSILAFALPD